MRVKVPEGAGGEEAVEGERHRGRFGVLQDTSVGRRLPAGVVRGPREEEAGEGAVSEGEEGDLGPP